MEMMRKTALAGMMGLLIGAADAPAQSAAAPGPAPRPVLRTASAFAVSPRLDGLPKSPLSPYTRVAPANDALPKYQGYRNRALRDRALQAGAAASAMPPPASFAGQANPAACL